MDTLQSDFELLISSLFRMLIDDRIDHREGTRDVTTPDEASECRQEEAREDVR